MKSSKSPNSPPHEASSRGQSRHLPPTVSATKNPPESRNPAHEFPGFRQKCEKSLKSGCSRLGIPGISSRASWIRDEIIRFRSGFVVLAHYHCKCPTRRIGRQIYLKNLLD